MRSANVSYFLKGVSQLGGTNMPPRDVYYLFEGVGDFPSSPQTIMIEFLLFPSISHQNPFVLVKFPNNSHQIPLVPIDNLSKLFCSYHVPINFLLFPSISQKVLIKFLLFPSIFFCSHQVPKQFPSNSSCSHQNPFVPIAMEDRQMSTKVNGETRERLGLVPNRAPRFVGRLEGELQWQADVCWVR